MRKNFLLSITMLLMLFFSVTILTGCDGENPENPEQKDEHVYSFLAPTGTPSLALATVFDNNPQVKYEIVAGANPLVAALTSGSHDFIVAPVNVGAKLFASNQKYKLVKTIVWGNFYIASLTEIKSVNDLEGKTITAFSQNSSPDIMLKAVLDAYGLTDKVIIEYVDAVTTANSMMMAGQAEIIISAEPSISVLKNKKTVYTIDLQAEWNKLSGGSSFPQAGLFVNSELLTEDKKENTMAFIKKVLEKIEDYKKPSVLAASAVKIDTSFETVGAANLEKAIPNCWISLKEKTEEQQAIKYYAEKLIALGLGAQIGGAVPSEAFYLE
jgi:ABC-type nitrate/sulfonate/bicarbonate transport system substrate-binding protein